MFARAIPAFLLKMNRLKPISYITIGNMKIAVRLPSNNILSSIFICNNMQHKGYKSVMILSIDLLFQDNQQRHPPF